MRHALDCGEFNARVGNDVTTWRGTLGRFDPAEQNKNCVKLLDFCALYSLVITDTFFQHQACHQHTWFYPVQSTHTGHMPDYVLANLRFRSSILDTKCTTRPTFSLITGW